MRLWVPGAVVVTALRDAGAMPTSGKRKVVWHTTEGGNQDPVNVANYLNRVGSQVHLIWNPITGKIVQMIPANRGGRGLANSAGGVETNRGGEIVFQIEVCGFAGQPWTDGPCVNLDVIVEFLAQLGISPDWPAGAAMGNESYGFNSTRTAANWDNSGNFAHQNVPENSHWDSGKINQTRISSLYAPAPVVPQPVPVPKDPSVIKYGMRGPKVLTVQKRVYSSQKNGWYGKITGEAVKKWRVRHGLAAVDYWDSTCDAAFQKDLARWAEDDFPLPDGHWYGINDGGLQSHSGARVTDQPTIKKIQKRVGATVDGKFGPGTAERVKAKQRWHKLNVDGRVAAKTWAKLFG